LSVLFDFLSFADFESSQIIHAHQEQLDTMKLVGW